MAAEDAFDKTKLNTVNRLPARASYDKAAITSIAQEAKVAHLAWTDETTGLPQCVPMLAALEEVDGDLFVYFHGS
jgi:nitroimidazol reductase NimA-like FMN-containing flavoprotein (pyridoxamine 5'-phosphate oxidase superfamily)